MAEPTTTTTTTTNNKKIHPLHQIAESPTHKLLLKQWLKEEDLLLRRISLKESQTDSLRREITALYCSFFLLHSLLLLLLQSSTYPNPNSACRRSWIPTVCSLSVSLTLIWAVRYKTDVEGHTERLLEREREDAVLLSRCVEELKKKGLEFDLMKEVDALRRAKSLRVDVKGGVKRWSGRDFVTLFLVAVACVVLGLTRYVLCD
ncbi:hypothetical protein QJS10_CPA09g00966 [Acorus calamus]|uniref:Transmembrane protein n=1 Tax=Acorus calamus TaxID=4465 RepID=A0AAV9E7J2_ACOCL|nr:hypothetical protein QJS10_CPA09g00966 [Acorus calamus]